MKVEFTTTDMEEAHRLLNANRLFVELEDFYNLLRNKVKYQNAGKEVGEIYDIFLEYFAEYLD